MLLRARPTKGRRLDAAAFAELRYDVRRRRSQRALPQIRAEVDALWAQRATLAEGRAGQGRMQSLDGTWGRRRPPSRDRCQHPVVGHLVRAGMPRGRRPDTRTGYSRPACGATHGRQIPDTLATDDVPVCVGAGAPSAPVSRAGALPRGLRRTDRSCPASRPHGRSQFGVPARTRTWDRRIRNPVPFLIPIPRTPFNAISL